MLIDCPECSHSVSDKAEACPSCGFPIRQWTEERKAEEARREAVATREYVGEVDCLYCDARGFIVFDQAVHGRSGFTWCPVCGHTGRVPLCHASDGYYAVVRWALEGFLAGDRHPDEAGIDRLGPTAPEGHKYPQAGKLTEYDSIPEWFQALMPLLRGRHAD